MKRLYFDTVWLILITALTVDFIAGSNDIGVIAYASLPAPISFVLAVIRDIRSATKHSHLVSQSARGSANSIQLKVADIADLALMSLSLYGVKSLVLAGYAGVTASCVILTVAVFHTAVIAVVLFHLLIKVLSR